MRSRCRLVTLTPLSTKALAEALQQDAGLNDSAAGRIARLSGGSLEWSLAAADDAALADRREAEMLELLELPNAPVSERFAWARRTADAYNDDRETVYHLLDALSGLLRDALNEAAGRSDPTVSFGNDEALQPVADALGVEGATEALEAIITAREALEANVNPRLALESLMLAFLSGRRLPKGEYAGPAPR